MIDGRESFPRWKQIGLFIVFTFVFAAIGIHESKEVFSPVAKTHPIRLLFLGDVMFDRDIRKIGELHGYRCLWGESDRNFKKYDDVIFNLEGPITEHPSVSLGSAIDLPENTTFTFSRHILEQFPSGSNFLVHIGNNHILDFGYSGLLSTEKALSAEGIKYFGDIARSTTTMKYAKIDDYSVVIVSFNEFLGGGINRAIEEIKRLKKESSFVVVYTHWGAEYKAVQPRYIKEFAHRFIDAGADLVVGSHPHVVGEVETYKGKQIYYSLGNFIFDQYFSRDTQAGLAVEINITDNNMQFFLYPTKSQQSRVELIIREAKKDFLSKLADLSQVGEKYKNQIKNGAIYIK